MIRYIITILCMALLVSCNTQRKVEKTSVKSTTAEIFASSSSSDINAAFRQWQVNNQCDLSIVVEDYHNDTLTRRTVISNKTITQSTGIAEETVTHHDSITVSADCKNIERKRVEKETLNLKLGNVFIILVLFFVIMVLKKKGRS